MEPIGYVGLGRASHRSGQSSSCFVMFCHRSHSEAVPSDFEVDIGAIQACQLGSAYRLRDPARRVGRVPDLNVFPGTWPGRLLERSHLHKWFRAQVCTECEVRCAC